ncbi:MAG: hypothetical protein ACK4RK_20250 [Gemmataceae bacterium]
MIKADLPLSQVYKSADDIITAKVESIDAEKNIARLGQAVAFSELSKGRLGRAAERALVLQLDSEKSLAGKLAKGDAVVIFVTKKVGAVHIGDSWFLAEPATSPNWRLTAKQNLGTTFPGTTPSLIRALLELRAEKSPIVDMVMHHTWHGDQYVVQKLNVAVKAMASEPKPCSSRWAYFSRRRTTRRRRPTPSRPSLGRKGSPPNPSARSALKPSRLLWSGCPPTAQTVRPALRSQCLCKAARACSPRASPQAYSSPMPMARFVFLRRAKSGTSLKVQKTRRRFMVSACWRAA